MNTRPIIIALDKLPSDKRYKSPLKSVGAPEVLDSAETPEPQGQRNTKELLKEYTVRILDSPLSTSSLETFGICDDEEILKREDEPSQTLAQLKETIDAQEAGGFEIEKLGEFLYNKIIIGCVKSKLDQIKTMVKQRPYRLYIRVDETAPLLDTIPWEYLWEKQNQFIGRGTASMARVLEDREPQVFLPVEEVSMLLVYANPVGYGGEEKYKQIDNASALFIQSFVDRLENAYRVRVTKLLRPDATRENLLAALSGNHFDIVHFIGHGEVLGKRGNIVTDDEKRIPGAEISSSFMDEPPRLFYFNSCSTAKADGRDPFSSIAQVLIKHDKSVPAVVAMQYDINVRDSFEFARAFYERLLNPESKTWGNLEAAMDLARRELQPDNPAWGIPVLFLQNRERVMLFGEPTPEPPPSQQKLYLISNPPPPEPSLVNRESEIASVREFFSSDRRLMMVTGLPGIGRSTVVGNALAPRLESDTIVWLNFEGIKSEDATLDTLYLSLDENFNTNLQRLWNSSKRPLSEKIQALERRIPNTTIIVVENVDTLLDDEQRFRDQRVEQFFLHFARTPRRIFIITTAQFAPVPGNDTDSWQLAWQRINITGLKPENAVLLLRQEGLTQIDEQLTRLAIALDGHPQALKIIAAAIIQDQLDLDDFLQAPESVTEDLTSFFAGTVFRVLNDQEVMSLKCWSVFRNPVLREALVDGDEDSRESQRIVDSLQAKGILRVQDDYYFVPRVLRSVAYAELKQDLQLYEYAHARAASFFLSQSYTAIESLRHSANAATENEFINNRLEAQYHFRLSDTKSNVTAQEIAENLFQMLMDHGRYRELGLLIEQSPIGTSDTFKVNYFKAQLKTLTGNSEEALDILRLLELSTEAGSFERAIVANEIGVVLKERSDPKDATEMLKRFEEAYDLFGNVIKTSDDLDRIALAHWHQAKTMYNRGLVYQYFRRGGTPDEFNDAYLKARDLYQAALEIYENLKEKDEEDVALVFSQLGELYADRRFKDCDLERADRWYRKALEIAERTGKPRLESRIAYQLARFLRHRGEASEARTLFRRAATEAAQIGLLGDQVRAEVQIAEIDFKLNQYDKSNLDRLLAWCEDQLSYYDDAHSIRVQSDAYFLHALLYLAHERPDEAAQLLENSRDAIFSLAKRSQGYADARRIVRATVFLARHVLMRHSQDAAHEVVLSHKQYFHTVGYKLGEESIVDFLDRVSPDLER